MPNSRQAQHVVVIGAGVVGLSTALKLAEAGHRVDVYEAASEPAQGASFANAGLISPGHCFSWSEPGAVGVFIRSLFGKADGLGVIRWWSPRLWRWVGQRPMTLDGIPILGRSRHANLLFNCGRGAMGWTMASGCAQIICDLIAARTPAIDCRAYRWDRF